MLGAYASITMACIQVACVSRARLDFEATKLVGLSPELYSNVNNATPEACRGRVVGVSGSVAHGTVRVRELHMEPCGAVNERAAAA